MSYTYLQEQGEESSAASFSDIPAFVLSRLSLTAVKSCSSDSGTESCPSSPSGMMSEPSTESPGEGKSMSCVEASHAKTLALQEKEPESLENDLDCGPRWPESLARYNPILRSWKTAQYSLHGGLDEFSGTWPQWGMMRIGESWERIMPEPPKTENACGWWPTVTASDAGQRRKNRYSQGGQPLSYVLGGAWNPNWAEWLMGWPIKWTEAAPLEMGKFRTAWLLPGLRYVEDLNK